MFPAARTVTPYIAVLLVVAALFVGHMWLEQRRSAYIRFEAPEPGFQPIEYKPNHLDLEEEMKRSAHSRDQAILNLLNRELESAPIQVRDCKLAHVFGEGSQVLAQVRCRTRNGAL